MLLVPVVVVLVAEAVPDVPVIDVSVPGLRVYPVADVPVVAAPPLVPVVAPPAAAVSLVTVVSDVDVSVVLLGQPNMKSASASTAKSVTAFFIAVSPSHRGKSNGSARKQKRPAEAGRSKRDSSKC